MKNKKIINLLIILFLVFVSCDFPTSNINEESESGFILHIRNYSDVSYKGCVFYIGAINEKNVFIPLDSLVYKNLYINNKNENGEIDGSGKMFSYTSPFKNNKQQLTKYSTWAPPADAVIKEISPTGEISLKLKLFEGKTGVFNTDKFRHGSINVIIFEDGSIK